jgi:hypothetical protein
MLSYPDPADQRAMAAFASTYVRRRLEGFAKDIKICLRPIPHPFDNGQSTVAYFPALGLCCATLDYLANLYCGQIRWGVHPPSLKAYAATYLPQPDYSDEIIEVLIGGLRHSTAHRGIAGRVWPERRDKKLTGRRLSWKIYAGSSRPAIRVEPKTGETYPAPWPCHFTHRTHVYLASLAHDLRESGTKFSKELLLNRELVDKFTACMHDVFPT